MIVTTPDVRIAFSMMRPTIESASRPGLAVQPVEATAPRIVRRALSLGLASAAALVVILAG